MLTDEERANFAALLAMLEEDYPLLEDKAAAFLVKVVD